MNRKPNEKEILGKKDVERFKNHLRVLYSANKLNRRDFIISVLITDNVLNKEDIRKLALSDIDLKKGTISKGIELKRIPKEIIPALEKEVYFCRESKNQRLFNVCPRQIYNIFVKRTRIFFEKRIPPSFFKYTEVKK